MLPAKVKWAIALVPCSVIRSPAHLQWHFSLPCFLLLLSHSRDDSQTYHLHPTLGSHSAFEEPKLKTFPGGSDGKESTCDVGDLGSIPRLGSSPGGGHGNPLQYSCLENPHGQRSLAGYSPWGHKESNMTKRLSTYTKYTVGEIRQPQ